MIRPYEKRDKKQLLELLRLNTPTYFDASEEKEFIDYLELHIEDYYVVEEDNAIIGSGGINYGFDNGKTARLSWDMVHPDWQGKGIGSSLTLFRMEHLKKNPGINQVMVRTSQLVHDYYQKFGFQLEKTEKDFWAKGLDLYQMTLAMKH